jgi:hypothetical protein
VEPRGICRTKSASPRKPFEIAPADKLWFQPNTYESSVLWKALDKTMGGLKN